MRCFLVTISMIFLLGNLLCDEKTFPALKFQFLNKPSKPIETRINDLIDYSFILHHGTSTQVSAIKISITIMLSRLVTFNQVQYMHPNTKYLVEKNGNIKLQLEELKPLNKAFFNFTVRISDVSLIPGFHHVMNVVKMTYDSYPPIREMSNNLAEQSFIDRVPIIIQGCELPLGMTDERIKYYQFAYSTAYEDLKPDKARLDKDAWCASESNDQQFVEVLFQYKSKVTAISTWGRKIMASWVKKFKLLYSDDGISWEFYSENGNGAKIFNANNDQNTEVKHWLLQSITTNHLRIQPIDWNIAICLRFELYGCPQSTLKNCINPLSMEAGEKFLKNSQSAIVPNSSESKLAVGNALGWKVVQDAEWLQLYFGSIYKLTKIEVQGLQSKDNSLLHLSNVRYSNNSIDWSLVNYKKREPLNKSPSYNAETTIANNTYLVELPNGVIGRYIRISLDNTSLSNIILTEIYGCLVEPSVQHTSTPLQLARRSVLLNSKQQLFVCIYNRNRLSPCCRKTLDGENWKDISSHIVSVISHSNKTRKLFAVDREMNILMSHYDNDDEWQSVSIGEWETVKKSKDLLNALSINDILPYNEPIDSLTIKADNYTWGVSNRGVHLKQMLGEWKLVSTWICCEK